MLKPALSHSTLLGRALLLTLALAILPALATAQEPVPLEFVIVEDDDDRDYNYLAVHDVHSLGETYLVSWQSDYQDIGNGTDELYAALVTPDERFDILIEAFTDGAEAPGLGGPITALDPDGGFTAVWSGPEANFDNTDVFWRRFSATGSPLGPKAILSTVTDGDQGGARVAISKTGITLATWGDVPLGTSTITTIGRYFDSTGAPLGPEFEVHSDRIRAIEALDDGRFIAVWSSTVTAAPAGGRVYFGRFLEPGQPLLTEAIQLTISEIVGGGFGLAAMDGGGFAIAWTGEEPGGDRVARSRIFDSTGAALGGEVDVSPPLEDLLRVDITSGPDGNVVVAWSSRFLVGNFDSSNFARRVGPSAPIGAVFPLQTSGDFEFAFSPKLARMPDDGFLEIWLFEPATDDPWTLRANRFPADGDLREDLRAYWRADEGSGGTAADLAPGGVADDGALGTTAWGDGQIEGGLVFDGDDHVALAASADLDVDTAEVTVAGWVRPDFLPSELTEPFAGIFDATDDNYVLYFDRDAAEVRFRVTDSDGTVGTVGFGEAGRIRAGEWHHLAGVYDGAAGELRLYLGGNLLATHTDGALVDAVRSAPAQVPSLGRNGTADEHYFSGSIDDLAVWAKALTATEIRFLVGLNVFGDGFESGDTAAWSLTFTP